MSGQSLGALLDEWAARFQVTTVLERVVGAATPACVAVGRGRHVTCIVDDEDAATRARVAYGGAADVRTAADERPMPKCDLVVVHGGAPGAGGDWRGPLGSLVRHAVKVAVVVAANPRAIEARVRSLFGASAGRWGDTQEVAAVLWAAGRVRDHVWLEAPALAERAPRFTRSLARSHAFVVDVTPRSPQARRKLRLSGESA
jgi:hypothetical protein